MNRPSYLASRFQSHLFVPVTYSIFWPLRYVRLIYFSELAHRQSDRMLHLRKTSFISRNARTKISRYHGVSETFTKFFTIFIRSQLTLMTQTRLKLHPKGDNVLYSRFTAFSDISIRYKVMVRWTHVDSPSWKVMSFDPSPVTPATILQF